MSKIIGYMAHDAVSNTEAVVDDYGAEALSSLAAAGVIFVAVHDDGTREVVEASEVTEPEPQVNGVTLVTPKYVDARTEATVAVFDALAAIVDPESSAATADETGEAAEAADPVQAFKDALAALRALGAKEEAAGD